MGKRTSPETTRIAVYSLVRPFCCHLSLTLSRFFPLLQMSQDDAGAYRCTDIDRNVLVASTDFPAYVPSALVRGSAAATGNPPLR